jgi:Ca2+-binding EF-hand superfamily protein
MIVSHEGGITVTEFMLGACNKTMLIHEISIKQVYERMDKRESGLITRGDLSEFLGVADESYIGLVMEEADEDCDGGLTYKEFYNMMMRITRLC